MSGHSKWSTIKHKKGINDAKKGKIFSKLSVLITQSARQGGGDPNMNPTLRLLLVEAKSEGFPADNIKKAIDKGTGNGADSHYEEASYEGFGPGGIQLIVDVLSTNTTRVVSELRGIFTEIGGRLGDSGSVSWNFSTLGWINLKPGKMVNSPKFGQDDIYEPENREDVELALMDIDGINDIKEGDDDSIDLYFEYKDLGRIRDQIIALGYVVKKAEIVKVANIKKKLEGEELEKAINALEKIEEYDDVVNIWTDLED
jgi:YebC/PmpR family DNA-binding regulatory protein